MASLMDTIEAMTDAKAAAMNTALPGEVVSYDSSTGKAEVRPLVRLKYADGTILTPPIITNVPILMPRTAGASLTLPIAAGDPVLIVFAQWSIDNWASEGGLVDSGDARHHSMSDAFAIPGAFSFKDGPTGETGTVLKGGNAKVRIKDDKVAIGKPGVAELLVEITDALDDAVAGFAAAVPPYVATGIIAASAKIKLITGSL